MRYHLLTILRHFHIKDQVLYHLFLSPSPVDKNMTTIQASPITLGQLKGNLRIRVKPRRSSYGFQAVGLGQLTCKHCEHNLEMMTVAQCPRPSCHNGEGFYCRECQAMDCYKPECEALFAKPPQRQLYNIAKYYDYFQPRTSF